MAFFPSRSYPDYNLVFTELLPQILDNSSTSSLVCLRLVNQQWNKVATQILLKRGALYLKFDLQHREPQKPVLGSTTFYSFKPGTKRLGNWHLCPNHRILPGDLATLFPDDRSLPNFFRLVTSQRCRASSFSFPVNHFGFLVNQDNKFQRRKQPQLLSFFQNFGPNLTTLTLDNCIDYFVGHRGMPYFLLQYTPNLRSLNILEGHFSDNARKEYFEFLQVKNMMTTERTEKFTLHSLKFLELGQGVKFHPRHGKLSEETFEILQYLLDISPQLQQVSFPLLADLQITRVFPRSRINLLRIGTLRLNEDDLFMEGLENLEYLIEMMMSTMDQKGVCLKRLILSVGAWPPTRESWKRGSTALRQILQLNLNSIQTIDLLSGAPVIVQKIPGLPALPQVTQVSIGELTSHYNFLTNSNPGEILPFTRPENDGGVFSPGNLLSSLFPNLETLVLIITDWTVQEDGSGTWFPFWNEELKHVKSLQANYYFACNYNVEGNVYRKSLKLCPEISDFQAVWSYNQFQVKMTPLYDLTQLTSVYLTFEDLDDPGWETFADLDAALTGLSKETVLAIYNNWQQCGEWQAPKNWRVDKDETGQLRRFNSSLMNLENLRKLELNFSFGGDWQPQLLISGVSAKFAFDLMENLEVLVLFTCYSGRIVCPQCDREYAGKMEKWLELHKFLLTFPSVTVRTSYY